MAGETDEELTPDRHSGYNSVGDDHLNIWVTGPPFVWLPAVMVLAALAGHLLIFRALRLSRQKNAVPR